MRRTGLKKHERDRKPNGREASGQTFIPVLRTRHFTFGQSGAGSEMHLCWYLWRNLDPVWRRQCRRGPELTVSSRQGGGDGGMRRDKRHPDIQRVV